MAPISVFKVSGEGGAGKSPPTQRKVDSDRIIREVWRFLAGKWYCGPGLGVVV